MAFFITPIALRFLKFFLRSIRYCSRVFVEWVVVSVLFIALFTAFPSLLDSVFDFADRFISTLTPSQVSSTPSQVSSVSALPTETKNTRFDYAPAYVPPVKQPEYRYCTTVLSIDGGGIRGIIPAMVLEEIERQTGKRISELFDLIVGTSTGGLLALALSRPDPENPNKPAFTAKELVSFYEQKGGSIFPQGVAKDIRRYFRPKYRVEGIERVLKDYFGDTLLAESLTGVIVLSYEIEDRKHVHFKSYENDSPYFLMRDIALAAMAAPTYFPSVKIKVPKRINHKGYFALIDGGIYANNPAPYAYIFGGEIRAASDGMLLISLGTGSSSVKISHEDASRWGIWKWGSNLLDIVFSDPGLDEEISNIMSLNPYDQRYYRFQPTLPHELSKLDDVSKVEELKTIAKNLIDDEKSNLNYIVNKLMLKHPPTFSCGPRIRPDWRGR